MATKYMTLGPKSPFVSKETDVSVEKATLGGTKSLCEKQCSMELNHSNKQLKSEIGGSKLMFGLRLHC